MTRVNHSSSLGSRNSIGRILVHEILLTHLTRDEVVAMLSAMFALASPVRADFLEALYGLTQGNSFFIEEMLKALVAAGEIFYHDGIWDLTPSRRDSHPPQYS